MATSESTTNEFPVFPPLRQEVPVETVVISTADSDCHHKLDDPLCNCDNIIMSLGNQLQMLSYLQKLEALTVDPHPVCGGGDTPDVDIVTMDNDDDNDNGSSPNTGATTTVEKEDISSELNKELEKIMRESQE